MSALLTQDYIEREALQSKKEDFEKGLNIEQKIMTKSHHRDRELLK